MNRDVIETHARVERQHWWFEARRRIMRAVADAAHPADMAPRVLDMGCGVGAMLTAFRSGYSCIGYDPAPDAIEFGRERHPDFDLRLGSAADAAPDIARASIVLLNDVLEHVPDDRALLTTVVEAMRPGAVLIVSVPNDMRLWSPHDEALGHYRRYDPYMLGNIVGTLPLHTRLLSHFNTRLYPIVRGRRMLTRFTGHASGHDGTDLSIPAAPVNDLLTRVFAGEARRLVAALAGRARPYARGVSLLAVLERTGADA
jgi:2-polyprenyl-3-methyl-5-hydroxy-6-metoxy-1,4-benzoquinol methylase